MNRTFLVVATVFTVGCSAVSQTNEEGSSLSLLAGGEPRPEGTIAWQACPQPNYPDAECGTIRVPIDWSKPNGETQLLTVERLKASNPGKRRGTLLFASGIATLWFDAKPGEEHAHSARLREHFDIVGIALPKLGGGPALQCDPELSKAVAEWEHRRPKSEAEYDELDERVRALGQDCRQHNGALAESLDDTNLARHMDAFRAGLGEEKIHLYARSVASQVGARYAELFPERLRALAFDSVIDHSVDATTKLIRHARGVDASFVQFTGWASRTPGSALYGENVQALWDRLHAKARAGKLIDPNNGKPITARDLSYDLAISLNRQPYFHSWPEWAQRLADLDAGRPTAGFEPEPRTDEEWIGTVLADDCTNWDYSDMRNATALDVAYRVSDAHLLHFHERYLWGWHGPETCRAWPTPVRNPQHRLSIDGGPKTLLVHSLYDPNTSHANAVSVGQQIPGSVLVTYEGVGHGAYDRTPCIRDYVDTYFITGETPAPGTTCPAIWPTADDAARSGLAMTEQRSVR